jgi:hypothetical protein
MWVDVNSENNQLALIIFSCDTSLNKYLEIVKEQFISIHQVQQ